MKTLFRSNQMPDFDFIALTAAMWLCWFAISGNSEVLGPSELFFLGVTLPLSAALRCGFESFNDFRLRFLPRTSDCFYLTASFAIASTLSDLFLTVFFTYSPFDSSAEAIFKTTPFALAAFALYSSARLRDLNSSAKKKVVLELTAQQGAVLQDILESTEIAPYLQFLSRKDLQRYAERGTLEKIDLVVLSRQSAQFFDSDGLLLRAHLAGVPMVELNELTTMITRHIHLRETDLSTYLLGATQKTLFRRVILHAKYLAEPSIALAMAIGLSPLLLLIAILIKCRSPGPVLYTQIRTGYRGRPFRLIKFRTMRTDAEQNGPQWCAPQDARVTSIGSWLRKTRLDELPQLWNVIRGEMSFLGPRPERPEIYQQLENEIPLFSLRTLIRPGISGWAQVCAGYASSNAESSLKLEYDLFYIQHMSTRFDLYILVRTLFVAFVGDKISLKTDLQVTRRGSSPTPLESSLTGPLT